jgi:hypothetical protein
MSITYAHFWIALLESYPKISRMYHFARKNMKKIRKNRNFFFTFWMMFDFDPPGRGRTLKKISKYLATD